MTPIDVSMNCKPGSRLSQAEFDSVADAHLRFVERRPGGARAILISANLQGLDLAQRNLREADFTGANLFGARLAAADLERAVLFCADLRECDLRHANLRGADLRGVGLRGADLTYSNLDGADLRAAGLLKQDEAGAMPRDGAKAEAAGGVDFGNCSMKGTSLNDANLEGASFRNAILQGVTFKRAKLHNVCLDGAVLTQVNNNDLPFSAKELTNCLRDSSPAAMARAGELRARLHRQELWAKTGGAEGATAPLDSEDLRPLKSAFRARVLTALSAKHVVAIGVDFSGSELQGANFSGADLRDANFDGADLRGAIFRDAKLAHARFAKANVRALPLLGRGVQQTDLTGAGFVARQFARALRDDGMAG